MSTQEDSSGSIDDKRQRAHAYEYLCRLEEARRWLQQVLKKDLPPSCELEQHLRNGIELAHLASIIAPKECPTRKIYDPNFEKFQEKGLHYRCIDNINMFFTALKAIKFPKIFFPETTDIYDAKNMVKCIFCIHGLAHYLASQGIMPLISSLFGEVVFEEQEISMIQKYLEKSGVKMPAFSKIDGLLATELSEDDAAIHAAVILVSEAIDREDASLLYERLNDPVLRFSNVHNENSEQYLTYCSARKKRKVERSELQASGDSLETSDIYDKILSRTEIYDSINNVNSNVILNHLNTSLKSRDENTMRKAFADQDFNVGAIPEYLDEYVKFATEYFARLGDSNASLTIDDVKSIVKTVNSEQARIKAENEFVEKIEIVLKSSDLNALVSILKEAPSNFVHLNTAKPELAFHSLKALRGSNPFDRTSISVALILTQIVLTINQDVIDQDIKNLITDLKSPELGLKNIENECANRYLTSLEECRNLKDESCPSAHYLLVDDITSTINTVNKMYKEEKDRLEIISLINEGISELSVDQLFALLNDPRGMFKHVISDNREAYIQGLRLKAASLKSSGKDSSGLLWYQHVQGVIDTYNVYMDEARVHFSVTDTLNKALLSDDSIHLIDILSKLDVTGLIPECISAYKVSLKNTLSTRHMGKWNGWLDHHVKSAQGVAVYYNHKTKEYSWKIAPKDFDKDVGYLNAYTIQQVCSNVGSDYNRELYFQSNIDRIMLLQSYISTLIKLSVFQEHLDFMYRQVPNIVIIQSYARMVDKRVKFWDCINRCESYQKEGELLKSAVKTYIAVSSYQEKVKNYDNHVSNIIAFQSRLRSHFAQTDYDNLIHMDHPSLYQVYRYLNLLDMNENDVFEENELKRLRNLAHDRVREIDDLENDIKGMYVTIGLLVKNKIDMHGLESKSGKGRKRAAKMETSTSTTKEQIELRTKYGHVFFLLQHVPCYTARLARCLNGKRPYGFIKTLFFNIFNLGTSRRDEYHLIKALEALVDLEITDNVDTIAGFSKEELVSTKLAIAYARDIKAATFLQTLFSDPVSKILSENVLATTNPVEIYKSWIASYEAKTGKSANLPFEVDSAEVALQHSEVCEIFKNNIDTIISYSKLLRDSIINNLEVLPYSFRYFLRAVKESLQRKFKDENETEILKVNVHLLFYRFLCPVIVGPECYGLTGETSDLTPNQRRNLATVSSIIKNAASGQFFESNHPLVNDFNDFLRQTEKAITNFINLCMDLPPLETYFDIHEFSDKTQMSVPEIKLTYHNIFETHNTLLLHRESIFPSEDDPLLSVIKSIGDVPPVTSLVTYTKPPTKHGKGEPQVIENEDEEMLNTLTVLNLTPPKEFSETDESHTRELLDQTVTMIIDILRFAHYDTLTQVLLTTFTNNQETAYQDLLAHRDKILSMKEQQSIKDAIYPTLSAILQQVKKNIIILEEKKIISSQNDHHDILLKLVRRLVERTQFFRARRMDLARIRTGNDELADKIQSLTKQFDLYQKVVKGCIENMSQRKKKKKSDHDKPRSIKLKSKELMDTKIIASLDNVLDSKMKNVTFFFTEADEPGTFIISAKVMGVAMDSIKVNLSDLLQMQYNNVFIYKIAENVSIRVNFLIHFLNTKFYK